jgi:hypothetical protein
MSLSIAKFLSLQGIKSVIERDSVLISPIRFFKQLEEKDPLRGDKKECQIGGFSQDDRSLVWSWSYFQSSNELLSLCKATGNDNVAALISTVSKIEVFLSLIHKHILPRTYKNIDHHRINYVDANHPILEPGHTIKDLHFYKDIFYKMQQEYRFVIHHIPSAGFHEAGSPSLINGVMFECKKLSEFIDWIWICPKRFDKELRVKLQKNNEWRNKFHDCNRNISFENSI